MAVLCLIVGGTSDPCALNEEIEWKIEYWKIEQGQVLKKLNKERKESTLLADSNSPRLGKGCPL